MAVGGEDLGAAAAGQRLEEGLSDRPLDEPVLIVLPPADQLGAKATLGFLPLSLNAKRADDDSSARSFSGCYADSSDFNSATASSKDFAFKSSPERLRTETVRAS